MNQLTGALILLPLIGFLINFIFGKKLPKSLVGIIGSGTVLISFIISATFFSRLISGSLTATEVPFFDWIAVSDISIPFSFLIDRLSVMMLLIITGIGFLIHVYSIGYMHDDEGFYRFFAYLNLFIFFMQMLVLGANYLVLFIGWEGVGLCSYLLIGFWFKNQEYNNAAKKAFIMNRIGDLGFLLGIFWIYNFFGSIQFKDVFPQAANLIADGNINDLSIIFITLLLFIGATGKSAQIPLYTWLPDAMAGPTPVSALIHAATMVTAGIYLIVRSHILFYLAPYTLDIVTGIGLATAIFAGTIGLAQNDIKKVLAYSTVSQLGFMFMALGLGAYSTAMFHLATHAFFKALLFLGAGSVIHAMGGEQDIRLMGGLRKKLPITFITFLVGTLAIAGIAPFAGFFSKDEILAKAFEHNPTLWVLGLIASIITAIYMFRLLYLTFFGEFRGTEHQREHLHESPATMTLPLIILAILSAIGGFMGVPEVFGMDHALNNYLSPILADIHTAGTEVGHAISHNTELMLMAITMGITVVILFVAAKFFIKKTAMRMDDENAPALQKLLANKYYVDEFYSILIVQPLHWISSFIHSFLEIGVIDGIVNGAGRLANFGGRYVRFIQNGNIGFYIFAMVISIIAILALNAFIGWR